MIGSLYDPTSLDQQQYRAGTDSMSILDRTTENKYGLQLGEFFDPTYLDLSRCAPPSEDELRLAIRTLTRPEDVSCETFKLILAMEWTPTCAHLSLLLSSSESEADVGVFPSCINLLQQYCQEGRGVSDVLNSLKALSKAYHLNVVITLISSYLTMFMAISAFRLSLFPSKLLR